MRHGDLAQCPCLQRLADGRHPVHLIVMERDGLDPLTRRRNRDAALLGQYRVLLLSFFCGHSRDREFHASSSVIRILPKACQASLIRRRTGCHWSGFHVGTGGMSRTAGGRLSAMWGRRGVLR